MQIHELKEQLLNKQLNQFYIFFGPETTIRNMYVEKIVELAECPCLSADDVETVYNRTRSKSMLEERVCFIVRNDYAFVRKTALHEKIRNRQNKNDDIIILIYDKVDKRGNFYKHNTEFMTEFAKLDAEVLVKYIRNSIDLDIKYVNMLIERSNRHYDRILLEIDKIKQLADVRETTIDAAFEFALHEGLMPDSKRDVIFLFTDAVCMRKVRRSYNLYQKLKETQDSPLGAMALLYINFRNMLLVRTATSSNVAEQTGLTEWQIKKAREKGVQYTVDELQAALRKITEVEQGIKAGKVEYRVAIDIILAYIF